MDFGERSHLSWRRKRSYYLTKKILIRKVMIGDEKYDSYGDKFCSFYEPYVRLLRYAKEIKWKKPALHAWKKLVAYHKKYRNHIKLRMMRETRHGFRKMIWKEHNSTLQKLVEQTYLLSELSDENIKFNMIEEKLRERREKLELRINNPRFSNKKLQKWGIHAMQIDQVIHKLEMVQSTYIESRRD